MKLKVKLKLSIFQRKQMMIKMLKITKIKSIVSFLNYFSMLGMVLILPFGLYFAINSPMDYMQGNSVKIMYIHVPAAWMALGIYSVMAILNIFGFIFRNVTLYIISKSIATSGCVFTFITLATGSIWGRAIWNAWWVWDGRLTSVLILFFLYLGYIFVVNSNNEKEKSYKIGAIISIVGFINIPIIKFSVDIWNTLHQKASITRFDGNITVDWQFLLPCLLIFGFYIFYTIWIFGISFRNEININKIMRFESEILSDENFLKK